MYKKIGVMVLILILAISSLAAATNVEQQTEAAKRLVAMGILTGYEDGSLKLENNITRAEFATLAVRLLNRDGEVANYKKDTIFSDVKKESWASGYINIAVEEGLITGYEDETFRPQQSITYAEILAILVRALGYDDKIDTNEPWPTNYTKKATELGIDADMTISANEKATRGDVVLFVDNSLVVELDKAY